MIRTPLLLIFLLTASILHGQSTYVDTSETARITAPVKFIYDSERGDESGIYNGILYYSYSSLIDGVAFFKTGEWNKGTVLFDEVWYKDIFMRYELVSDLLIVAKDTSSGIYISLYSPRVKEFSYSGMQFLRFTRKDANPPPETGFYQVMVNGKLTALRRSVKVIEEKLEANKVDRWFEEKTKYYMVKDGIYHRVNNKKDILSVCKDHKKEVQQFLSKRKIKYRQNPENMIVLVAGFYNQL